MALAALLASALLMASGPATFQLAQADSAVPTTSTDSSLQASADAVAAGEDPFPAGAPTDDFGFMGWCYGALAGHIDLYEQVMPEVRRIETQFPDSDKPIDDIMQGYADQNAEGRRVLEGYARALSVEEATGRADGARRAEAVTIGRDIWRGAPQADPRQLAQLWMSWGLPGRCDATAQRLAPSN